VSNVTTINRARIVVLAQAAIHACQALIAETEGGAPPQLAVQPPVRPPKPQRELPAGPQCPKCGGEMKRRNSSRGPFFGCKQYPHCDGTRPGETEANPNSVYAPGHSESDEWEGAR
jgi:hypothetical protein